tara:strand:+ start:208 stop:699 length:492 start_codon:yes stop_codon:yes gene_type:complete
LQKIKNYFYFKTLLTVLIFIPCFILGQITSPTLISNSGGSFANNTIIMDFSIGELAVQTLQNNEILTQGFHQEVLKIGTLINELEILTKIYPNPTSKLLFIELKKESDGDILMYDIKGKLVLQDKFQNQKIKQLDISTFSPGNYLLHINIANKNSVFKIEKFK